MWRLPAQQRRSTSDLNQAKIFLVLHRPVVRVSMPRAKEKRWSSWILDRDYLDKRINYIMETDTEMQSLSTSLFTYRSHVWFQQYTQQNSLRRVELGFGIRQNQYTRIFYRPCVNSCT